MNYGKTQNELSDSGRTTDAQLMRLVDGELSTEQRRELLKRLDAEHGGWRRCAAMFLEDQSLKTAFAKKGNSPLEDLLPTILAAESQNSSNEPSRVSPQNSTTREFGFGNWKSLLASAAMLAAAFLFGMSSNQESPSPRQPGDYPNLGTQPVDFAGPTSASENAPQQITPQNVSFSSDSENSNWPSSGNTLYVQDNEFFDHDTNVPPALKQFIEQKGYRMNARRGWIPMKTPDGRQLSIPYEDVQFVPAQPTSY